MIQQEHLKKMKNAFYSVFRDNNSFGKMFKSCISEKLVLCPINGYHLKKEQFEALKETARVLGEVEFLVSMVECSDFFAIFDKIDNYLDNHWIFNTNCSYKDYQEIPIVLENALYSGNGKWGVLVSHENHAVIGGSKKFIQLFKEVYENWDHDLSNFTKMWEYNKKQYNSDLTWLSDFLKYIDNPYIK